MLEVIIRETGFTPKLAAREKNRISREAVTELGEFWHENYLPEHFTHRGASKYGYTPRSRVYEQRKLRTHGHTYPLVFSGQSQQLARIRDVRATATKAEGRVRVVIHAPALNFRPRGGRIDMRKEITTVVQSEMTRLEQLARQSIEYKLNNLRGSSTEKL